MNDWKSEQIADLCAALSAAQGAIKAAERDAKAGGEGSKFSYKYATLEGCWDIARPAFAANGLAFTQWPFTGTAGELVLRSILTHSSGQWLMSEWAVTVTDEGGRMNPHQAEGSALTYTRKYSLCAVAGIPQADDDGAGASTAGAARVPPAAPKAAFGMVPIGKKYGPTSPNPKAWTEVPIDYLEYCSGTDNPAMRDPARAELERRSAQKHSDSDPGIPPELR